MSYPLPPIPEPPRLDPDPRQQRATRVVSGLLSKPVEPEPEAKPLIRTGFPAAAVDLGVLQRVIEEALHGLSIAEIHESWPEVEAWLGQVTRSWVQRCKSKRFEIGVQGIEIALETQDDYGYYHYAFVVPTHRLER